MKLSILICTIPGRFRPVHNTIELINRLTDQAAFKSCQILYLGDNKSMTVGAKRNKLLSIADGEFVAFVDDDDQVSDDYVDTLLRYCDLGIDCVTIGVDYYQDGRNKKVYDYTFKTNINFRDEKTGVPTAGRMPDHLCLWKKDIATRIQFPEMNLSEDRIWSEKQILAGYQVEHRFFKVIYTYNFDSEYTQTRRP